MPFKIVRNDITKVKADVIVNTANPNPICASGTDLAIYEAAGKEKLLAERANIGKIARGDIAVTGAYSLNAKYIIHTVGPVWTDGLHHEFEILEDCYRKSLQKALELKCDSIAFPLISTGVYGFPKDKALQIAVSVFSQFLTENEIEIILVVFDKRSFQLSGQIVGDIDSYIDANYVKESHRKEYPNLCRAVPSFPSKKLGGTDLFYRFLYGRGLRGLFSQGHGSDPQDIRNRWHSAGYDLHRQGIFRNAFLFK